MVSNRGGSSVVGTSSVDMEAAVLPQPIPSLRVGLSVEVAEKVCEKEPFNNFVGFFCCCCCLACLLHSSKYSLFEEDATKQTYSIINSTYMFVAGSAGKRKKGSMDLDVFSVITPWRFINVV